MYFQCLICGKEKPEGNECVKCGAKFCNDCHRSYVNRKNLFAGQGYTCPVCEEFVGITGFKKV